MLLHEYIKCSFAGFHRFDRKSPDITLSSSAKEIEVYFNKIAEQELKTYAAYNPAYDSAEDNFNQF